MVDLGHGVKAYAPPEHYLPEEDEIPITPEYDVPANPAMIRDPSGVTYDEEKKPENLDAITATLRPMPTVAKTTTGVFLATKTIFCFDQSADQDPTQQVPFRRLKACERSLTRAC